MTLNCGTRSKSRGLAVTTGTSARVTTDMAPVAFSMACLMTAIDSIDSASLKYKIKALLSKSAVAAIT